MRVPEDDLALRAEERREALRRWLMGHFQDGDRPSQLMRAIPQLDKDLVYQVWEEYLNGDV